MNHRIQIMVDDQLNNSIKAGARKMGLSISSYARLILMNGLTAKKDGLLKQAMDDLRNNEIESLTYSEFCKQIDEL